LLTSIWGVCGNMGLIENISSYNRDFITGDRIALGDKIVVTPYKNRKVPMGNSRMKLVKEETIVWLAEQAGYTLVKRDAGDAKGVDAGDAESGDGAVKAGKAKAGGKQTVKRRASGPVKGE
jgi:hypothetical protein